MKALITAIVLMVSPAFAAEWQGECVSITDGDTIRVMRDGREERIRLHGIDAPERRQDFSARSREFAAGMTLRKVVTIITMDTDRYGRTVALVEADGESVNRALVAAGLAWVYPQYCTQDFCADWLEAEAEAREAKRGLWAHPKPVPPWEWRRERRRK